METGNIQTAQLVQVLDDLPNNLFRCRRARVWSAGVRIWPRGETMMTTQPRTWRWLRAGCMFAACVGLIGTICLAEPPNDSQRNGQRGRPNNPQGGGQQ